LRLFYQNLLVISQRLEYTICLSYQNMDATLHFLEEKENILKRQKTCEEKMQIIFFTNHFSV